MNFELRAISLHVKSSEGPKALLDQVSFTALPGQITVILGPNGAGKSTALGVMANSRPYNSGSVHLNGRPLETWSAEDQALQRAVVAQSSSVPFAFRAHEIVTMGRMPHQGRTTEQEGAKIVDQALELADVSALADRAYPTLSGGEKQRVQLARALAQIWHADKTPRYLLLDEPTSNLDLAHQAMTMRVARRFADEGVGVVAVLHDLNLALTYADKLVLMKDGKVVAQGTPLDVLTPESVQHVFNVEGMVLDVPEFENVAFVQRHI